MLALASIASAAARVQHRRLREWGPASVVSSRTFAVLWVGIIVAAAFPFALAMSFALLSIWALQQGRRGRFAVCAVLTLAASPLGFVLLTVVVAGAPLARRSLRDVRVQIAVVVGCAAASCSSIGCSATAGASRSRRCSCCPACSSAVIGLLVTRGVPTARPLRGLFWIYLLALVAAYVVPSSVGSNIERIRYLGAAARADRRRAAALAAALARRAGRSCSLAVWNTTPIAATLRAREHGPGGSLAPTGSPRSAICTRTSARPGASRWWTPPSTGRPPTCPTPDPDRARLVPPERLPAERAAATTAGSRLRAYEAWLRRMGVRYVVLADAPADYSARGEARLIRSGGTHLVPVFVSRHLTVYELPDASPLVVGPAGATVLWLYPSRLVAVVGAAGDYRVKVRWSPYWHASSGCVSQDRRRDGATARSQPRPRRAALRRRRRPRPARARRPVPATTVLGEIGSARDRGAETAQRTAGRARGPARLGP